MKSGQPPQQYSVNEQDSLNLRVEQTAGKEPQGVSRLINEMSYIHNASSNDNLLSPYMFSNNSLSPTNPNQLFEKYTSQVN